MKTKQESSGFNLKDDSLEKRKEYVQKYFDDEGILMDINQIEKNSGRRQVAKLMANSQWGYLGMNTNKVKFVIVTEFKEWLKLLNDDKLKIHNVVIAQENALQVYYSEKAEHHFGGLKNNVILASFVTAQARLKLYSEIFKLDKRVLYIDTDSIFFLTTKNDEYQPYIGTRLGEFTKEIDPSDGEFIKEWASCGKKNYTYMTDKNISHCTVKGFTMNYLTQLKITFDSIKNIVLNDHKVKISCEQLLFSRNKKDWSLKTNVQKNFMVLVIIQEFY